MAYCMPLRAAYRKATTIAKWPFHWRRPQQKPHISTFPVATKEDYVPAHTVGWKTVCPASLSGMVITPTTLYPPSTETPQRLHRNPECRIKLFANLVSSSYNNFINLQRNVIILENRKNINFSTFIVMTL